MTKGEEKGQAKKLFFLEHEESTYLEIEKGFKDSCFDEVKGFMVPSIILDEAKISSPDFLMTDLYILVSHQHHGLQVGVDFIRDFYYSEQIQDVPIVIFSRYVDFVQNPEKYQDKDMQFGPFKKYNYEELKDLQKQLDAIRDDGAQIYYYYKYDFETKKYGEQYDKLAQQICSDIVESGKQK